VPVPTVPFGYTRAPNKDFLLSLSARRHSRQLLSLAAVPPPATWDSVALGWVGSVKNQSQCGSCWDFSGTGVVECAYNKAGVGGGTDKMILSEQYTLSCGRNGGCNGDDNVTVLQWAKDTGLPMTADYGAYAGRAGRCGFSSSMTLYKIDDWGFADGSGGHGVTPTPAIKAAIMAYGCVGAAIAADNAFCNNPSGKVFQGHNSQINHDIILVGWDDGKGAWKLRNSWGSDWCDNGYCWIAYGANSVGTEAVWALVHSANPPIDWSSF
jgi:cathepsin L